MRKMFAYLIYFVVFLFLVQKNIFALDLPFEGRFVQQFSYNLVSISASNYYQNSGIVYEQGFVEEDNRETTVEEVISYATRSAYLGRYYAVMFDYTWLESSRRFFSSISSEKEDKLISKVRHQISPAVFAIYYPVRVGISYHHEFGENIENFQELTLRPANAVSLQLQFFFDKIPNTAIGVGGFYQYAFNPYLTAEEILEKYFQKAGLSFHVYFAYYLHFSLRFSWERLQQEFSDERILNEDALAQSVNLTHRTRYMLQYNFIYGFSQELSLFAKIAQVVYSNFESPDYRFVFGVNLSFGKD